MRRYSQAADVLLRDLATFPDDAYTRAFLSTCLCLEEDHEGAAEQAAQETFGRGAVRRRVRRAAPLRGTPRGPDDRRPPARSRLAESAGS